MPIRVPTTRRGATSVSTLLLGAVIVGCTVLVANRALAERDTGNLSVDHGVVAGTDTAPSTAPTVRQAFGTATVRDLAGKTVPLAPARQPTIVMINSRTCPWCKKALRDIGQLAAGRPLPRLTLLTLEGADAGVPMVNGEQITGARLVGPSDDAERERLTARFRGTPTFIAVDRNGRILQTMPGYPIYEEMKRWHAVMAGEAAAP
jgi:hypothetical protein